MYLRVQVGENQVQVSNHVSVVCVTDLCVCMCVCVCVCMFVSMHSVLKVNISSFISVFHTSVSSLTV